jgi:Circadian oscillating protein COP23
MKRLLSMTIPSLKVIVAVAMLSSIINAPFESVSAAEQNSPAPSSARFFCGQSRISTANKAIPTTFAHTKRGNVPVIRWQSTFFSSSNVYTPQKRCEEVSRRFQKYYSEGTLAYLTAGQMNAQNVICVSDEYGGPCQGLVLTLEPKDNPQVVLKDLLNARNRAGGPLTRSTGSLYVDMNSFLETTPVEEDVSPMTAPVPKIIKPKAISPVRFKPPNRIQPAVRSNNAT